MTAAKTKESVIDVPELSIVVPIFNVEDYLEQICAFFQTV